VSGSTGQDAADRNGAPPNGARYDVIIAQSSVRPFAGGPIRAGRSRSGPFSGKWRQCAHAILSGCQSISPWMPLSAPTSDSSWPFGEAHVESGRERRQPDVLALGVVDVRHPPAHVARAETVLVLEFPRAMSDAILQ
jgi:hypothetical protein